MNEDLFLDLSLGFHLRDDDLSKYDSAALLAHGGDWQTVAAANLMCRRGDTSRLSSLIALLKRTDDTELWDAIVNLIGFAGNWALIHETFKSLSGRFEEIDVRYNVAALLGSSCDLRAIPFLLDLYRVSRPDDEAADQIMREISVLLERSDGEIFYLRQEQVSSTTLARSVNILIASLDLGATKVFEAQAIDIVELAQRLLSRLDSPHLQRERFSRGKLVFEAATGIDCSQFFDEIGRLNRLAAVAVLEDFLDGDHLNFVPGQRYFFGHPIPD
jgi:hypothetical protein